MSPDIVPDFHLQHLSLMFDALAGIELAFAFGSPSGILEASPAELAIVLRDNELAAEMAPCW